MRHLAHLAVLGCVVFVRCSSGGGDGSSVAFHGQASALPGFSYDTGPQPPTGPASVAFSLSSGGTITADTQATQSGGMLNGTAGAGTLALDLHIKMGGHLKFDAGATHYDGDIPGMQNVDIAIAGTAAFDGFAMQGQDAQLVVNVPQTELPPIPLGGIPGNLQLTVSSASTVTTTFHGVCLTVQGGQATFTGETVMSGTLVLGGSIVPDIPLVDPIPLPAITVQLPSSDKALPFDPVAVGVSDGTTGNCNGQIGNDGGPGADAGGSDSAKKEGGGGGDSGQDPESVLIDSSLVAYYKFNEGSGSVAIDASGNGHAGALVGNIQWSAGKVKQAMHFDGSTASADMGQFSFLNTNGTWTIMFWASSDSVSDNRCLLDANIGSSGGPRFYQTSSGLMLLDFGPVATGIAPFAASQWHHFALTSDFASSTTNVYFDGGPPIVVNTNNSIVVSFDHFIAGNGNKPGASHYQGLLDDLRIYKRAVSPTEVALVYNAQK